MVDFSSTSVEGARGTTPAPATPGGQRFALLGNPNAGKTTLFNRLCGHRAHTANYPGITVEARVGERRTRSGIVSITDLPGLYGLHLDLPESLFCRLALSNEVPDTPPPDGVVIVLDATNLARHLVLCAEVLALSLPAVVVVNQIDRADRQQLQIDFDRLREQLGVPVVAISALHGTGLGELEETLGQARASTARLPDPHDIGDKSRWAREIAEECTTAPATSVLSRTDRLDSVVTHPLFGGATFVVVMTALFVSIFSVAAYPMAWIEWIFAALGQVAETWLPAGALLEFLRDGVIGGVAGTVVFIPQIFLLFFLISLLEGTGYLARAAFVADRWLRRFGLPGQAFVPLLSSHACAIPGILCTRLIPDRRDRLATILVAPFMSCSARLPVYVLLIGLLFRDSPLRAGLAFTGCYLLGATAALLTAFLLRRAILRGASRPMVLELPGYQRPSLRTALYVGADRSWIFLRKAGTVILAICMVLWWLSTYPASDPPPAAAELRTTAERLEASDPLAAGRVREQAERLEEREALSRSFAGRLGHLLEPALAPIGYDWQLSIAVLTSFAAREVFVSTLAVILGTPEDVEDPRVLDRVREARRDDGELLFDTRTCASLLIFYVLAMQCLPTLAVTRREAGGWRWALLQLAYMSFVAYLAALATYHGLGAMGVGA